jgi:hypothetical protein
MEDKTYFLPARAYAALKWLGLVALPALAVFYGTCAPAWGWPDADAVVLTLNAAGLLVGVLIGASQATAKEGE